MINAAHLRKLTCTLTNVRKNISNKCWQRNKEYKKLTTAKTKKDRKSAEVARQRNTKDEKDENAHLSFATTA